MSKTALKHILLTPDKTTTTTTDQVFNPIPNKYDFVSSLAHHIKNSKAEIIKIDKKRITTVENNLVANSLVSSSFKTQTSNSVNTKATTATTATAAPTSTSTRILVKRHKPVELQSITRMGFHINDDLVASSSTAAGDVNSTIKQNVVGSMSTYGNFFSNPFSSHQDLVDPTYNQGLLGLRSRTIYVLSPEESKKLDSVLKSNEIKKKQQQQQLSQKAPQQTTSTEADTDMFEKPECFSSSTIINEKITVSKLSDNNNNAATTATKKENSSDGDSKDVAKDTFSSNNSTSHHATNHLSKNIFLNYRPQTCLNNHNNNISNSSNSSLIVDTKLVENNVNVNQIDNRTNTSHSNNNMNKKLNRRNSTLSNQRSIVKNSKNSVERESVTHISSSNNIIRHNPERYLDKYTIVRIEKWIQDVNAHAGSFYIN